MSSFSFVGVTYTGPVAGEWYTEMLLTGPTISENRCMILTGVKSKVQIPSLTVADSLTAATCDFTASGTIVVDTKTLETVPVQVNKEICQKDILPTFLAERLRAGQNAGEIIPQDFADFLMSTEAKEIAKRIEIAIWQADTTTSPPAAGIMSLFDGWLKLFQDDATTIGITATTLTAANIQAELTKVQAAIPAEMIIMSSDGSGDAGIFLSPTAYQFYRSLVYASGPSAFVNTDMLNTLTFMGIPLFVTPGMPANKMVFTHKKNLWFGTDLEGDMEDIILLDMRQTTLDRKIRLGAQMLVGVQFGVGAEVVYYGKV